jgi:hypothetical protein
MPSLLYGLFINNYHINCRFSINGEKVLEKERVTKREGQVRERKGEGWLPLSILFLDNRLNRTYFHTVSAFRAFFFIDGIGFTLLNRICWTFLCTGATCHAFIGD